ncbi:MAG TPA: flavodoxin family protein [Aliiroseovarius sp.]|nr:flavodoxin family protein [Aliiroseovarius sp.]
MQRIVIPHFSGGAATRNLAQRIAEGCEQAGLANAQLISVDALSQTDWQTLEQSDAIIFGTPTYMGGVAAPMKAFMDQTASFWAEQRWADKLAAGFTCGANTAGDKLATLQHLAIFAAQHGMIWVGQNMVGVVGRPDQGAVNPDGAWLGLAATTPPQTTPQISPADAETARLFGARIAKAAHRWKL